MTRPPCPCADCVALRAVKAAERERDIAALVRWLERNASHLSLDSDEDRAKLAELLVDAGRTTPGTFGTRGDS